MRSIKQAVLALSALCMCQLVSPVKADAGELIPTVLHRTANVAVRIALAPIDAPLGAVAIHSLGKGFSHKSNSLTTPFEIVGLTGIMLVALPIDGAINDDPMPTIIDVLMRNK